MPSSRDFKERNDFLTLNIEFHLFFPRITERRELLETISQLQKRTFRFYYSHIILAHSPEPFVKDHHDIVDALRDKANKKPEKLMEAFHQIQLDRLHHGLYAGEWSESQNLQSIGDEGMARYGIIDLVAQQSHAFIFGY